MQKFKMLLSGCLVCGLAANVEAQQNAGVSGPQPVPANSPNRLMSRSRPTPDVGPVTGGHNFGGSQDYGGHYHNDGHHHGGYDHSTGYNNGGGYGYGTGYGYGGLGYGGLGNGGVGYGNAGYGNAGYGNAGYGNAGYGGLGYGGYGLGVNGPGYGYGTGYGLSSYGYGTGLGYSSGYGYAGTIGYGVFAPGANYGYQSYGYGTTGLGLNPSPLIAPGVGALAPGYGGVGYQGAWGAGYSPNGTWQVPLNNSAVQQAYDREWAAWSAEQATRELDSRLPNPSDPADRPSLPPASSPDAVIRSTRDEAQGDQAFQNQDYATALREYRSSASSARDRAEPYLKAALTMVALGQFENSIDFFQRAIQLDANAPLSGLRLDDLYGEDQAIAKNAHLSSATEWVKQEYRDPERLFLMGVLLLLNNDSRASEFLETAWRLGGDRESLRPLLQTLAARPLPTPLADASQPVTNTSPSSDANESAPPLPLPSVPVPDRDPYAPGPLFPLPSEDSTGANGPNLPLPVQNAAPASNSEGGTGF